MSDDEREIEAIAERVATKVVHQLFMVLGVDSDDNKAVLDFQKDLQHLRKWRTGLESISAKSMQAAAGFVVTAVLGYIVFLLSKH